MLSISRPVWHVVWQLVWHVAWAALLAAALASPVRAQDNVLVLLADDVGVDLIDVYGEGTSRPPTPNIDALAQNGVLFRNAWAAPLCSPARAALLTGRHPFRLGIGGIVKGPDGLAPSEITIPEMLRMGSGGAWTSAMFGKWHIDGHLHNNLTAPNDQGFAWFSGPMGNIGWRWAPPVPPGGGFYDFEKIVNGVTINVVSTYAATDKVNDTLTWLKSAPEPWFCLVAFNLAHDPYHAPPTNLHSKGPLPEFDEQTMDPRPYMEAMVEAMDSEIGRLLGRIDPLVRARTNVIFLSDNGTPGPATLPPFPPDHGKVTAYEGGLNVPLVVSGPAVESPGREVHALVGITDVFATVAELAGIDVATVPQLAGVTLDSVSFAPWLRPVLFATQGNIPQRRQFVFGERFSPNGFTGPWTLERRAVRDIRYKLIRDGGVEELYDLLLDPFEQTDLLLGTPTPQQQAAYVWLRTQLDAVLGS